jgi:hypothetical protein
MPNDTGHTQDEVDIAIPVDIVHMATVDPVGISEIGTGGVGPQCATGCEHFCSPTQLPGFGSHFLPYCLNLLLIFYEKLFSFGHDSFPLLLLVLK